MNSKKRWLVAVLLVVTSFCAFSQAKITLRFYQWFNRGTRGEIIAGDIEGFQKLYPNVKIDAVSITNDAYWDRLTLDITSNVEGDIVALDSTAMTAYEGLRQGGAFLALNDRIKGYTLQDGTGLEKDIMNYELGTRNGKLIALPYTQFICPHLAYRKSHLQEAGVDPKDLATWDSFQKAAIKLTKDLNGDGKIDRYGYGHPTAAATLSRWWHMTWLWTAGGGIFPKEQPPFAADRLIFNSAENVYALEKLRDIVKAASPPGEKSLFEELAMFNEGSMSTIMIAVWALARLQGAGSDYDYVPFPSTKYNGEARPSVYTTWGIPIAVSAISKHPKEAFDFIAFMHSEDAQKRAAVEGAPVNRRLSSWYEGAYPNIAKYWRIAEAYKMRRNNPDIPQWTQLDHVVQEAVKTALIGLKPPKEALDEAQKEMIRIMNQ